MIKTDQVQGGIYEFCQKLNCESFDEVLSDKFGIKFYAYVWLLYHNGFTRKQIAELTDIYPNQVEFYIEGFSTHRSIETQKIYELIKDIKIEVQSEKEETPELVSESGDNDIKVSEKPKVKK